VFAIGSTLTYLQFYWECATPPHVHPISRYVIAWDQFYQAFPRVSTTSHERWAEKAWVCSCSLATSIRSSACDWNTYTMHWPL